MVEHSKQNKFYKSMALFIGATIPFNPVQRLLTLLEKE